MNETIVVQANERLLPVVQSNPVKTDTEGAIYRTCCINGVSVYLAGFVI